MSVDMNMNVLIADHYLAMLQILRNQMRQLNFTSIQEVTDAKEALEKLRAGEFGLIISDWDTQPMSGLQLLQEVRGDAKLKRIPFIMIMGASKSENVIAAKKAGVSNLIVRPFNAEMLKSKLVSVLGNF